MATATEDILARLVQTAIMPNLLNVFSMQASLKIDVERVDVSRIETDLVAVMPIRSAKFQGLVALMFPEKTFLAISNQMLGENTRAITAENADAASELLNIVYASARPHMNQLGHDFQPAIPTVVLGRGAAVLHGNASAVTRLLCGSSLGSFSMECSLRAA